MKPNRHGRSRPRVSFTGPAATARTAVWLLPPDPGPSRNPEWLREVGSTPSPLEVPIRHPLEYDDRHLTGSGLQREVGVARKIRQGPGEETLALPTFGHPRPNSNRTVTRSLYLS